MYGILMNYCFSTNVFKGKLGLDAVFVLSQLRPAEAEPRVRRLEVVRTSRCVQRAILQQGTLEFTTLECMGGEGGREERRERENNTCCLSTRSIQ